ncbi:MAG TPA: hypothetical protein VG318_18050 [Actinomycetota bacterium]|nr:hypothetical protein [Actinomycetota bacterium]
MRTSSGGRRRSQLAAALLALLLGACVPGNDQIGLLRASGGGIEVLYVRCTNRNEAVRTVRLRHNDTGEIIWRIDDARPISESLEEPQLQRFVVGETPDGFTEVVELVSPLTESETYSLTIDGPRQEGLPWVKFELADLSDDVVYGPVEAPAQEFVESASEKCRPPEPPLGGVFAGRRGALLLGLVLLATLWLLAKRRTVSSDPRQDT